MTKSGGTFVDISISKVCESCGGSGVSCEGKVPEELAGPPAVVVVEMMKKLNLQAEVCPDCEGRGSDCEALGFVGTEVRR